MRDMSHNLLIPVQWFLRIILRNANSATIKARVAHNWWISVNFTLMEGDNTAQTKNAAEITKNIYCSKIIL